MLEKTRYNFNIWQIIWEVYEKEIKEVKSESEEN